MYTDEKLRECYNLIIKLKADKQKQLLEEKVSGYKKEYLLKAEEFKKSIKKNAECQLELIDRNTYLFCNQVDNALETRKALIDENMVQKQQIISLSLEDVKAILNLLECEHK